MFFAWKYRALSDEEVVEHGKQDKRFFAVIMKRYRQKILRYILRITNLSKPEAEDLSQEVFLQVWQHLDQFDSRQKFSPWLYKVTHNQAVSYFRKHKKEYEIKAFSLEDPNTPDLPDNRTPDIILRQKMRRKKVRDTLQQMLPKYRKVLKMKFFQEKNYEEIADELNISLGTVASRLNRAKKRFQQKAKQKKMS